MILDVFRCSQLFSDVLRMPSIDQKYSIEILRFVQDVLRCSQDVCRIFPGCFQDAPMGLVGLVEFDDHFK